MGATTDVVVDFTLNSGFVLSGEVITTGVSTVAISGTVFAQSETEIYSGMTTTVVDPLNPTAPRNEYRIVLPTGTYRLSVFLPLLGGSLTSPVFLSFIRFDLTETVVVNGDTEKDITVTTPPEFFTVSGQVFNPGSYPLTGGLTFRSEDGRVFNTAVVDFATAGEASAAYSLTLPAGTYSVSYFPTSIDDTDPMNPMPPDPEVSESGLLFSAGTVTVAADQVFDIPLPATVTLSGFLTDGAGVSLAGATITAGMGIPIPDDNPPGSLPPLQELPAPTAALCQQGEFTRAVDFTGATASLPEGNTMGFYEMPVVPLPEAYQVSVMTPLELMAPATVPPGVIGPQRGDLLFPFPSELLTITVDQMRDFVLPLLPGVVVVSGNVTDAQSQPVSNARVDAVSSMLTGTPNVFFSNDVRTNAMGDYQLLVLSGVDYTLTVCPPESSSPIGIPLP